MNNPYRSGTADVWYSGLKADLWVEYKFLPKIPSRASIVPGLSELQKEWLDGRLREGRNVAVIVGCRGGGVIYQHGTWREPLSPDEFCERICTRREVALWIARSVLPEELCS